MSLVAVAMRKRKREDGSAVSEEDRFPYRKARDYNMEAPDTNDDTLIVARRKNTIVS